MRLFSEKKNYIKKMESSLESYISTRVIKKMNEKYDEQKSEELYQHLKEDIFKDLDIICKQTGDSIQGSLELYLENNGNVVSSICSYFGIKNENLDKKKEHSDVHNKLDQLRIIANHKDKVYDDIKKRNINH